MGIEAVPAVIVLGHFLDTAGGKKQMLEAALACSYLAIWG